ncbi:hypothetical protein MFRU_012g02330 [Monilinia fructicola]|nr:hypothetical protein MFRU_012g02330 [Monilinia fructicola]
MACFPFLCVLATRLPDILLLFQTPSILGKEPKTQTSAKRPEWTGKRVRCILGITYEMTWIQSRISILLSTLVLILLMRMRMIIK